MLSVRSRPTARRPKSQLGTCLGCTVTLIPGANWTASQQKHRRHICRVCYSARQRLYSEKKPVEQRLKDSNDSRRRREESWTLERRLLESRRRYNAWILRTYGLTMDQYEALLRVQGGSCAICKGPPKGKGRFHVDHCHTTNVVRGLLCQTCNVLLGNAKDNVAVLDAAIAYLSGKKY